MKTATAAAMHECDHETMTMEEHAFREINEKIDDAAFSEAGRRMLWSRYGLDSYDWLVYYEASENKDELRSRYNNLKKQFLGPYFKESDAWEAKSNGQRYSSSCV